MIQTYHKTFCLQNVNFKKRNFYPFKQFIIFTENQLFI